MIGKLISFIERNLRVRTKVTIFLGVIALGVTVYSLLHEPEFIFVLDDLPELTISDTQPEHEALVHIIQESDGSGVCSGTVISDQYLVTAAHCLNLNVSTKYVLQDTSGVLTSAEAKPAYVDYRVDVGLMVGDFKSFDKMKLNLYKPSFTISNLVVRCGFVAGNPFPNCDKVTNVVPSGFRFAMEGMTLPGQSGGPVFSILPSGQSVLEAVIVAVMPRNDGMNVYVSPITGVLSALFSQKNEQELYSRRSTYRKFRTQPKRFIKNLTLELCDYVEDKTGIADKLSRASDYVSETIDNLLVSVGLQ